MIGLFKIPLISKLLLLIKNFKTRVLADGGTFEAEACLKTSLPTLIQNGPSLVITPNAVKAGKLYSIVPTDGTGDLTVTRATSATRVNSSGLIESVGANIARLDYSNGTCPSILVEPQRTNLVFPSATATTQTRTVTATAHTLSFYGTGTVTLSGVATSTLVGTGINNKVSLTFTPTAGSLILTVSGSVINWQLEVGSNATSHIPTTTATVTRNADVISKSGISSLIGQTEGVIYIQTLRQAVTAGNWVCRIDDGTTSNKLGFFILSIDIMSYINFLNLTNQGNAKIALAYKNQDFALAINGTIVATSSNLGAIPSMSVLRFSELFGTGVPNVLIHSVLLFKTRLTNTELQQLTTL